MNILVLSAITAIISTSSTNESLTPVGHRDNSQVSQGGGSGGFTIDWSMIDGGGAMHTGSLSGFELSGTIGQPDTQTLSSSQWTLHLGFWHPVLLGDCNFSGSVDLRDYRFFAECLTGPLTEWVAGACDCSDIDGDFDVDLNDVARFQTSQTGHE